MNPQRWLQIKNLYLDACDVDDAMRTEYLTQRCGDDHELLRAVRQLHDADAIAPEIFDRPAAESFGPVMPGGLTHSLIGRQIGAYRIVAQIASGGMGQVYLASRSDEHFHKDVAIKLVRPELVSEESVRRFADERQTLARLEHPNIARLLDGGITDDGYPYFIMEYVDGRPIDRYCDDEKLTIPQRLRLFQEVCKAVQFAHQNLIVHRDIKPGNVLIDHDGNAKLLDFGIAKVLATVPLLGAEQPVTRDIRMTPEYASPEQLRGEPINTRSDIYSLGVVLYQLLTGHHPYGARSRTLYELERQISDQRPDKPSTAVNRTVDVPSTHGRPAVQISPQTVSRMRGVHPSVLRRALAGDLDAIVLMAMHASPDRRYASADQLAEDIRRHLEGLPVAARPDTIGYRLRKFVRRRAGTALASSAAVLALIGGIIGTSWQARIANQRRDAAVTARAHAVAEAERARVEARKSDRVVQFFQNMLGAADPSRAGPNTPIGDVVRHFGAWVEKDYADDPEIESAIHTAVGQTYAALGDYPESRKHMQRALALQESLHVPPHADIANRHRDLSELYYKMREFESAEGHARKALEMDRAALGPDAPETAHDLNNLAAIRRALGDLDEAESLLNRALDIRRHLNDLSGVAATLNNLANLMMDRDRLEECERLCREALEIRRSTLAANHPLVAQSIDNLAVALAKLGRYDEAVAMQRESIELMRTRLGDGHPDLFIPLSNIANVLMRLSKYEEAADHFRKSLDIGISFLAPDDPMLLHVGFQLGDCLLTAGSYDAAEAQLLSIYTRVRHHNHDPGSVAERTRAALARLYDALGQPEKARQYAP